MSSYMVNLALLIFIKMFYTNMCSSYDGEKDRLAILWHEGHFPPYIAVQFVTLSMHVVNF